jgi:hypothetical protein
LQRIRDGIRPLYKIKLSTDKKMRLKGEMEENRVIGVICFQPFHLKILNHVFPSRCSSSFFPETSYNTKPIKATTREHKEKSLFMKTCSVLSTRQANERERSFRK